MYRRDWEIRGENNPECHEEATCTGAVRCDSSTPLVLALFNGRRLARNRVEETEMNEVNTPARGPCR